MPQRKMKTFKIGDNVDVLDDAINGVVTRVEYDEITIETSEGFDMTFNKNELVKTSNELSETYLFSKKSLKSVISEKSTPKKKVTTAKKPKERSQPIMEVDLHLHQLVANEKHLNNHDKKTIQLDTAKYKLEYAIKNNIQKIVFIHGVGEGVLKLELEYLFGRYDNLKFYDADYKKYGLGATEVYIFQNKTNN